MKTKYSGIYKDSNSGAYYINKMINGKYIRKSLNTLIIKEARQRFEFVINNVYESKPITKGKLPDLIDQYIDYCYTIKRLTHTTMKSRISRLQKLKTYFKDIEIGSITQPNYESYLMLKNSNSKISINNDLGEHISFFKWCMNHPIKNQPYLLENPLENIKKLKVNTRTYKAIPENIIKQFLDWIKKRDYELYIISSLSYLIGTRISELLRSEVSDIDLKNKTIILRNTKGKSDRICTLNSFSLEILYTIIENNINKDVKLLPNTSYSTIQKRLKSESKKFASINAIDSNITFHVFRHSFATTLVEKGVPVPVVSDMLGHKDLHTTLKYLNVQDERKQLAYDKIVL